MSRYENNIEVAMIYARTRSGVFGINNKLPFHAKEDMNFFKEKTTNNVVVMGKKTYESIPGMLPNRTNIIVSKSMHNAIMKNKPDNADFYRVFYNIIIVLKQATQDMIIVDSAMAAYYYWKTSIEFKDKSLYFIGGVNIFKEALDRHIVSDVYESVFLKTNNIKEDETSSPSDIIYFNFNDYDKNHLIIDSDCFKDFTRYHYKL